MSQASDIFRNIADSLPQIVWALAPDGRIVWVNRRFIDVTGRDVASESAIDDGHLTEFIHPDDLALATDWLAAFERGESYGYEFRLKVRGGSYRWFRAHATPYRGADGEIEAWFGVSTDVDDIKSADASIRAILETIPQSLFVSDSRGVLLRVNSQMCAYTGKSAEQLLGTGWLDLVHPEDTADVRAARERGIAAETVTECTFRMRRHDGALRYQLARWAPMRDAAGSVTLWSSTMTDVHDQVREREELRLLADTIPQFICVTRADGRLDYANQQFWAYTGRPAESESFEWSDVVHPDDIAPARAFWAGCIADAQPRPELELRLRRADGTYRWFSSRVSPRRGEPGDPAAYYTTATDITERKRSADMLAFLAEASDVLTAARDVPKSLEIAASLAVPRIADWCAIYLRESNGLFAPAAIHHTDPAKVRLAAELVRRYPFSVETERQLIEKKAPVFVPEISLEMLDRSEEPARGAMLRRLDIASAIVVPLIVDDAVTGMLHLVRGRANARFARADVDFAEIFANRIAVAIDNAVMFERERNVAAAFQNAALPQTLPDVDGIALHRAYRTGDSAVSVGGDWYDAVRLRDGSLLFSIGDVAGKGLDAAVLMGSMRQAIRVAGLQGLAPGAVLDAANAALAAEGSSRFVTAFVGRIDAAGRLDYASAGHPAPFLRCGDSLCELRLGDPPLGVWDGTFATHATVLREPWLLVAFTDGLIERTGNVSEGLGRLSDLLADDGIAHAADPAAYVQERLLRGAVRDDAAILTIRADGPGRWRFGADDALRAEPARGRLTAWLAERASGDSGGAELIYGELIGNVVRHSPGRIDVDVTCANDRVRLFVQCSGGPIEAKPLLPDSPLAENGRGLFIVDALGANLRFAELPVFGNQIAVDLPLVPIHASRAEAGGRAATGA